MKEVTDFERRIRILSERRESEVTARRERRRQTMDEDARRSSRLKAFADRLFHDVIEPRLAAVTRALPDTAYTLDETTGTALLRLNTDGRYLARVDICLGIASSGNDSVAVYSRPTIIPILMDVPTPERIVVPLDIDNDAAIAAFVEAQLDHFLAAYIALDEIDAYRQSVRVVDPVCGMEIGRVEAAEQVRYSGITYYFCIAQCKERFLEDPSRYV